MVSSKTKNLKILWSVDVEDYYMSPESIPVSTWDQENFEDRVAIGCEKLLHIFNEYDIRATWFFLGWVAERHPELVEQAHQKGHEIATHTYDHRPIHSLSPIDFRKSLNRSCDILEEITGQPVLGHRAPQWSVRSVMRFPFDILRERGLIYDSSVHPLSTYLFGEQGAPRHPYRVKGEPPLWELPPGTIRIFRRTWPISGGFFLRALPMWYMKSGIKKYNREGYPVVVNIHPWELDPHHPVPEMSRKERLIHCWGLKHTETRVHELVSRCECRPMRDYVIGMMQNEEN